MDRKKLNSIPNNIDYKEVCNKTDSINAQYEKRIDSLFDIDYTQKLDSLSDEYFSRGINYWKAMKELDHTKRDYIKKFASFYNRRK